MVVAVSEVKDGVVLDDFSFVLGGDFILVVFIVAFLAKVYFFCEAVNISFLILALLTPDQFGLFMLFFLKSEPDQVVRESLHFFEDFETMSIYFVLLLAFLVYD